MTHEFRKSQGSLKRYRGLQFLRNHELDILRALVEFRKTNKGDIYPKNLPINNYYPLKNLQSLNLVSILGKYPMTVYFDVEKAEYIVNKIDSFCGFGTTNQQVCERHFMRFMQMAIDLDDFRLQNIQSWMATEGLPSEAGFYVLVSRYDSLLTSESIKVSGAGNRRFRHIYPGKTLQKLLSFYKELGDMTQAPLPVLVQSAVVRKEYAAAV